MAGQRGRSISTNWFFVNNLPHIVSAFTALPGWQNLMPDLSNQLVTGGRGTRVTGYTAGRRRPVRAGVHQLLRRGPQNHRTTLAVLYFPNSATITIDQPKLPSGYNAKWIDPVTGATQAAAKGSSYNSATPGNNLAGDPDWVLILATPPYATWTVP